MNYNLKICIYNIYIIMSSIEPVKQDFGTSELNEVYANLDGVTKENFDKIKNEKIKIQLLKDISNPELSDLFNSLSKEKQKEYEMFGTTEQNIPSVDTMGSVTGMKKGGSASSRADGCAIRGKTRA